MNRDPILLALLTAILLTGMATTALLFEQRVERLRFKAETDKMFSESKAFTDKMLKDMPKLPGSEPDSGRPKADAIKELHCIGEPPNRKCEWK